MSTFKHLFEQNQTEHHYRIKTVKELNNDDIDTLERILEKYVLIDMSDVEKTIIQRNPLDFQDIYASEVFIVDVITQLPVSPYVLRQELKLGLNINEDHVVVNSENDPSRLETERLNAFNDIEDEAETENIEPDSFLSTKPEYEYFEQGDDGKYYYGDYYNDSFKEVLAKVDNEHELEKYEPDSSLFSWLGKKQEHPDDYDNNFNDHIEHAPKIKPRWRRNNYDISSDEQNKIYSRKSKYGNIDAAHRTHGKVYKDNNNNRQVLTRRKEKLSDDK